MRLWHKDLIPYLPRQQLLGQWRECCCIAKSIHDKGSPNHLLVNKIIYLLEKKSVLHCRGGPVGNEASEPQLLTQALELETTTTESKSFS